MSNKKISAVVIAKDEEGKLNDCFNSLSFVDEIIFVDNDSKDNSVKVANKHGAKIFNYKGGTFSERKNFAFKKVKTDWFLSLDADEQVTPELNQEIAAIIKENGTEISNSAYAIPRKNIILGKVMMHGGWWPDYVIRLFRTKTFKQMKGDLHEQPEFSGKLGYLENSLTHMKHSNLSEMVDKTNQWSEVEAKLMFESNHSPMNIARFASAGTREFWLRMIKNKGYLDGPEGIIYSLYQVFSRLVSYAKLWEMQLK